jgi:hypothetical protein
MAINQNNIDETLATIKQNGVLEYDLAYELTSKSISYLEFLFIALWSDYNKGYDVNPIEITYNLKCFQAFDKNVDKATVGLCESIESFLSNGGFYFETDNEDVLFIYIGENGNAGAVGEVLVKEEGLAGCFNSFEDKRLPSTKEAMLKKLTLTSFNRAEAGRDDITQEEYALYHSFNDDVLFLDNKNIQYVYDKANPTSTNERFTQWISDPMYDDETLETMLKGLSDYIVVATKYSGVEDAMVTMVSKKLLDKQIDAVADIKAINYREAQVRQGKVDAYIIDGFGDMLTNVLKSIMPKLESSQTSCGFIYILDRVTNEDMIKEFTKEDLPYFEAFAQSA